MTDALSCTERARSYTRAEDAGIEIENETEVSMWSTRNHPFDQPPPAADPVPAVTPDQDRTSVEAFGESLSLDPSRWVETMADCDCTYCGLHEDLLEDFENACLKANSDEEWEKAARCVLQRFRDWKYESLSEEAINHEAAIADTFDIDKPLRGTADSERSRYIEQVSPQERELVETLRQLSLDILESYYEFPINLYRGLGHHLSLVSEAILTDPTQRSYFDEEWECAVANFTPDPDVGSHFSEVALAVESDRDGVVSAPDFLTHTVVYYDDEDIWRLVTEGEIRIRTDKLVEVDRDAICAARAPDTSLPETIEALPPTIRDYDTSNGSALSTDQHRAVREAVLSFADFTLEDGELSIEDLSPPESREAVVRIQTWSRIYESEFNPDPEIDPNTEIVTLIAEEIVSEFQNP